MNRLDLLDNVDEETKALMDAIREKANGYAIEILRDIPIDAAGMPDADEGDLLGMAYLKIEDLLLEVIELKRISLTATTPALVDESVCQSRWYRNECALPKGHEGDHATEGRFTTWPDAADTRPTITASER